MENKLEQLKNLFIWPENRPEINDINIVYNTEDDMVYSQPGVEGSSRRPPQPMLDYLIKQRKPKLILELGSWMGNNTTRFLLENASEAHLICIDTWSSDYHNYVHKVVQPLEDFENKKFQNLMQVFPFVWDAFLINGWNNRHRLTPIRKKTQDGLPILRELNLPVDLIYIDAHHDYEPALHDIKTCCELWPDATICGDDLYWPDGGVRNAVVECANIFGKTPHDWNGTWYFSSI